MGITWSNLHIAVKGPAITLEMTDGFLQIRYPP